MCKDKVNNLVVLRCIKGLKQKDISDYLGIALQTYCNKENGNREFSLSEAKKLSDLFNCTIDEIFFDNEVFKMNT
ncbi:Helix-turn-helix domain [uncultured Clostridium sp.]|uniref:helix-turn-helix transcriptional regulator n=1 Tax=uncultured Clostridium sp. TaxID=59620 RepID=UPI00082183AD|nr:helix-turn-helix transcriptional regulator [uncultured Clostridium sp.]SCJ53375.1 Helix-turn-helix domain [uncultured Clostridium sp.]